MSLPQSTTQIAWPDSSLGDGEIPAVNPPAVPDPKVNQTSWRTAAVWILIATGISAYWGISIAIQKGLFLDFKAIYIGARCLLEGHNPYDAAELSKIYKALGGMYPGEIATAIQCVTININLPTTLFLITPFALLPSGVAQGVWIAMGAGVLMLAAFLVWRIGARYSPAISLLLIVLLLANNEIAFKMANAALVVVGLCVVAAWCFAEDKFALTAVPCFAICLAMKPHDAGWIWLFFLLAGGIRSRRAVQVFCVTSGIGLAALIWVWRVAPQWMAYWRLNVAGNEGSSGLNAPGPFSVTGRDPGMIIDLQSAISVLWNSPKIYNSITYLICGSMLLIWAVRTVKSEKSRANVWLGLAATIAPTLLITYHRDYDTKLLLLAVPACAMLWSKRGFVGWFALSSAIGAMVFTGDIPLILWVMLRDHLHIIPHGLRESVLAVPVLEPTPIFLLMMGVFYLWAYVRSDVIFRSAASRVAENRGLQLPMQEPGCPAAVAEVGTPASEVLCI